VGAGSFGGFGSSGSFGSGSSSSFGGQRGMSAADLFKTSAFDKPKTNAFSKPAFGSSYGVTSNSLTKGNEIAKAEGLDYGVSDRVKHIKFGVGTVVSVTDSGRDYEVLVNFDTVGPKKMFASFAKLKKV
jgi:DNA helicase-2/ATP-dependent DNA helicase PcrA